MEEKKIIIVDFSLNFELRARLIECLQTLGYVEIVSLSTNQRFTEFISGLVNEYDVLLAGGSEEDALKIIETSKSKFDKGLIAAIVRSDSRIGKIIQQNAAILRAGNWEEDLISVVSKRSMAPL